MKLSVSVFRFSWNLDSCSPSFTIYRAPCQQAKLHQCPQYCDWDDYRLCQLIPRTNKNLMLIQRNHHRRRRRRPARRHFTDSRYRLRCRLVLPDLRNHIRKETRTPTLLPATHKLTPGLIQIRHKREQQRLLLLIRIFSNFKSILRFARSRCNSNGVINFKEPTASFI